MKLHILSLGLCIWTALLWVAQAQLSKPLLEDEKAPDHSRHIFRGKTATRNRDLTLNRTGLALDLPRHSSCHRDVVIKWSQEVSSSVYGTPVITDLYSDGIKDILVPSFLHYLDALEGPTGAASPGYPADHHERIHASPLLYDVDGDGVQDILLATYSGELLWFQEDGTQRYAYYSLLPKLRVRKEWYKGLKDDPDLKDPGDVGQVQKALGAQGQGQGAQQQQQQAAQTQGHTEGQGHAGRRLLMAEDQGAGGAVGVVANDGMAGAQVNVEEKEGNKLTEEGVKSFEVFKDEGVTAEEARRRAGTWHDRENADGDAAVDHGDLVTDEQLEGHHIGDDGDDTGYDDRADDDYDDDVVYDDVGGDRSVLDDVDRGRHDLNITDDFHDHEWNTTGWDDEYGDWDDHWDHGQWGDYSIHEPVKGFIDIDAHVLGTPAIGDIDGDGQDEVVIGASFFFEKEYYDRLEHRWEIPKDLDMTKYVAGAVIAWDIKARAEKWRTHLDLSTDTAEYRAYVYSSPVLADLDADGQMEVIIGTSAGFVYVLDSKGNSVDGWPVEMGEVQATPLVADLNGDGWPEIFASDMKGNVALFDRHGKLQWARHVDGAVSAAAMAADVDGDGRLEIVFGSHSGEVHVIRGYDGKPVGPFPFMTGGRIMAPPLAVDLAGKDKKGGRMDVVVPSFDGYLYVIDGDSGCAEAIDLGENSYAQVLADDLDGDGTLDLVVATMNGQVAALETRARYHPLRAWTGTPQGNQMVSADRYYGVHAAWDTRAPRDLRGETFAVRFTVVDKRPAEARNVSTDLARRSGHGPYRVLVMLEGVGVGEMKSGESPVIGLTDSYRTPGTHTLVLPAPKSRTTATVTIKMVDPHGRVHRDSFALSFHVNFYRMLKWVLVGPFLVFALWAMLGSGKADPFSGDAVLPIAMHDRAD